MKKNQFKQNKKPNMDCVNLLTSILICYPEISIITFALKEDVQINYTLNKILNENEMKQTKDFILDSLLTYQFLEGLNVDINEITLKVQDNATFIDIRRDVKSFSHGEIRLLNELIKEKFADYLMVDFDRVPVIDLVQLELIDTMLGSLKINPVIEKMVGIRENGRVIVYNT